jgi:DUF1016 N-terminal domain
MAARKSKSRSLAIVQQPAAQLYRRFVEGIKERIRTAQLKAALAANAELVLHYWEIGREILASQRQEGWGAKVVDRGNESDVGGPAVAKAKARQAEVGDQQPSRQATARQGGRA